MRRPLAPINKIDVTAFASVMVVLVVNLMLIEFTTTSPHRGGEPHLPTVDCAVPMPGALREDAVVITVRRDGRIYMSSDELQAAQLPEQLQMQLRNGSERKAYIRVDARTQYGSLTDVLNAVRAVGIEKVGFFLKKKRAGPTSL